MHTTAPLKISLFGNPEVSREGKVLTNFRHRKTFALLAYLAVTGESHSRERLAGLLWGQASETNALGGLRKVLAELRSAIGPYLVEQNRSVAFNQDLPSFVDVVQFEQRLSEGLVRKAELLNSAQSAALQKAVDLYTNDFLNGFYIRRAPVFEDWVTLTRERLRLNALDGLYLLGKAAYRQSHFAASIRYTRQLLELEPCHEEAHRQLMSLYALTGQRDMALLQYETCQNILEATYQIAPQEETISLYERILQEPAQSARGGGFDLPIPTTPLVGRQADLDALQTQLSDANCKLLTILGPGGSGKTHLALGLAGHLQESYPDRFQDGIVFVPLSALRSIEALPSAIAHQIDFQFHKEQTPIRQLSEHLAGRHMLLILDNFEHLLTHTTGEAGSSATETEPVDANMLSLIQQYAPEIKIVVTSRVRLQIKEEYIYPLSGIAYPSHGTESASALESSPAVTLFIQNAQRMSPDFEADDANLAKIGSICRQVRGLPLGILLAAGWSSLLSPAEIAAQLSQESGMDLLESEHGDFPLRQRSLRAVLSYSWKLLTEHDQATLAALSLFRGTFGLSAAQHVSEASLSGLRSLVDHSLLQRTQNGRYEIHEFTRQFLRQKLEDGEAVRRKFLDYYANRFPSWAMGIKTDQQLAVLKTMDLEIDNLQAAWEIAISTSNLDFLDQALESMWLYYLRRHRFTEGLHLSQGLVSYFERPEGQNQMEKSAKYTRLYARALTWMGVFTPLLDAETPIRKGLAVMEAQQTTSDHSQETLAVIGRIYYELAWVLSQIGKIPEAIKLLEKCIAICEQVNDRWMLGNALNTLGSLLWDQSEYDLSNRYSRESLKIQQEIGNQYGIASALLWLGMNALFKGDYQGEAQIRESVSLYTKMGDYQKVVDGVGLAGVALMILGKFEEGRSLIEETVMTDPRLTFRQEETESVLACAYMHLGDYEKAHQLAKSGLKNARQLGNPFAMSFSLLMSGWLALIEGENNRAFELFEESGTLSDRHGLKDVYTWALASQCFAATLLGDIPGAQKAMKGALDTAVEIESYIGMVFSGIYGLPLVTELGGAELGIELYAALATIPIMANSVLFTEQIGKRCQTAAEGLPARTVAAAQARGEKLDLAEIIAKINALFPEND